MIISKEDAVRILELEEASPSHSNVRLNYQQLALKWHPSKHGANVPSVQKFEQLCRAYLILTEGWEQLENMLTPAQMFDVFVKAFEMDGWNSMNVFESSDSDGSLHHNGNKREQASQCGSSTAAATQTSAMSSFNGEPMPGPSGTGASPKKQHDAMKGQKETSKRAARKKRRKQRQKENVASKADDSDEDGSNSGNSSGEEKEEDNADEDLDLNSAFVATALSRKGKGKKTSNLASGGAVPKVYDNPEEAAILQSRNLASRAFDSLRK